MSLQNNGLARRIYADSDSALQLEGFYNEISTPVLSDVEISYVGEVTEEGSLTNMKFPAYYRGGEIVIAGKLKDGIKNLNSRVQGHASEGFMQFDTDIKVAKVEKQALQTAYSNFTEKLWAFMTIRNLLDKMLQSSNETEKMEAKAKALELSLKYSFVTPLTSMVVTKPDEPKKNIGDVDDPDEQDIESRNSRGSGRPGAPPPNAYAPPARRRPSFVDNDPHFIVHVDGMTDAVCFNLDGPPGMVYQLLYDRVSGVVVNGLVVGKKVIPKGHKYPRTYIGELMIMYNGRSIHITPHKVIFNNNKTTTLQWKHTLEYRDRDLSIFIEERTKVFVKLGDNITLGILRHLVKPGHKTKVNFLGLYVVDDRGLSVFSHGLIGQFMHQTASLHNNMTVDGTSRVAELRMHGPHSAHKRVTAKRIRRRDLDRKDYVTCWNVKNNGRGLLTGQYSDYIVPDMTYERSAMAHYKIGKKLFSHINNSRRE